MPITKELENINEFESVGFDHNQAKTLTKIIEQSHVDSHESLKGFIRNELDKQTKDFDSKLYALETRLIASQKDILIKIFGIVVGTVGVAVTILKLF